MSEIINRVANSPILTIDLEKLYVHGGRAVFDLKDFLFQGLVLKEKDFRQALKELDWRLYKDKYVAITCTADAIVPTWAFMLVMTYLEDVALDVVVGTLDVLETHLFFKALESIDPLDYRDRPVVVKGCSKFPVPFYAYGEIVKKIMPFAKSVMYGEPCSTVPLYKKKRS